MSDLTCMQCAYKSPLQPPNLLLFPPISINYTLALVLTLGYLRYHGHSEVGD